MGEFLPHEGASHEKLWAPVWAPWNPALMIHHRMAFLEQVCKKLAIANRHPQERGRASPAAFS
jgi:hypothetical protein